MGDDYQIDLPNIRTDEKEGDKEAPKANVKKKVVEVLMLLKQKADVIAQLKQVDPQAFQAIMKVVQALTEIAQQGLMKNEPMKEFVAEESSEGSQEFFEQSESEPKEPVAKSDIIDKAGDEAFWEDVASSMTPEDM